MNKKTIIPASAEAKMAFEEAIASIHKSNPMPNISKDDKIGGKLSKKVEGLLDKAILYAPKFEEHLPRQFDLQELVDDHAFMTNGALMIQAFELEIQRIKDAMLYTGIRSAKKYRIIYEAGLKAADDDASLTALCDELGGPYQRPPLSDEKKAEIALTKANIAAEKAAVLAAKAAAKAAK